VDPSDPLTFWTFQEYTVALVGGRRVGRANHGIAGHAGADDADARDGRRRPGSPLPSPASVVPPRLRPTSPSTTLPGASAMSLNCLLRSRSESGPQEDRSHDSWGGDLCRHSFPALDPAPYCLGLHF
jgi:hypothetical protein